MSNLNKMAFDLKEVMNNPEVIQNMIKQNLTSDMVPKTKEEEREELRKKLRAKINQESMKRQSKDVQMKEQVKNMKKNSESLGLDGNMKEMMKAMMNNNAMKDQFGGKLDAKQLKRVSNEFEKFIEKDKE